MCPRHVTLLPKDQSSPERGSVLPSCSFVHSFAVGGLNGCVVGWMGGGHDRYLSCTLSIYLLEFN